MAALPGLHSYLTQNRKERSSTWRCLLLTARAWGLASMRSLPTPVRIRSQHGCATASQQLHLLGKPYAHRERALWHVQSVQLTCRVVGRPRLAALQTRRRRACRPMRGHRRMAPREAARLIRMRGRRSRARQRSAAGWSPKRRRRRRRGAAPRPRARRLRRCAPACHAVCRAGRRCVHARLECKPNSTLTMQGCGVDPA